MKATLNTAKPCKFTPSHRKEGKCFFSSMSVVSLSSKPRLDGVLDPAITLRLYGTGSRNSACLWVSHGDDYRNGSGQAGGYGYHRPSAAAQEAINNAGFALDTPIDGLGEEAMREALLAIAKCLGVKRPAIIQSQP